MYQKLLEETDDNETRERSPVFKKWKQMSCAVKGAMRPVHCIILPVIIFMGWSSSFTFPYVHARSRSKSRLELWIDSQQINALIGSEFKIPIISHGQVTPYLNNVKLLDELVIPPEIDTVNLTWQSGGDSYTYLFDNFTSLDQHLLYQPLLGIPAKGYIPRFPTVFQITIPCKGKDKGVASLVLGLKIFDYWRRPLKGTPLQLRLKKQCVVFALCSPPCENNGTCISPSLCDCPPGYYGQHCEKAVCGRKCLNGGHCVPEGYCWCTNGFFGDACNYSRCNPHCKNGGTCVGNNQCRCADDFTGPLCEIRKSTDLPKKRPERSKMKTKSGDKLEVKIRRAEQRLLKIAFRRSRKWGVSKDDRLALRKLQKHAERKSLTLQEKRFLIKMLTRERKYLNSKDKTKLKRFKTLIRKSKQRQARRRRKKRPRKRLLFV